MGNKSIKIGNFTIEADGNELRITTSEPETAVPPPSGLSVFVGMDGVEVAVGDVVKLFSEGVQGTVLFLVGRINDLKWRSGRPMALISQTTDGQGEARWCTLGQVQKATRAILPMLKHKTGIVYSTAKVGDCVGFYVQSRPASIMPQFEHDPVTPNPLDPTLAFEEGWIINADWDGAFLVASEARPDLTRWVSADHLVLINESRTERNTSSPQRGDTVIVRHSDGSVFTVGVLTEAYPDVGSVVSKGSIDLVPMSCIEKAQPATGHPIANLPFPSRRNAVKGAVVRFRAEGGFWGTPMLPDYTPSVMVREIHHDCVVVDDRYQGVLEVQRISGDEKRWVADECLDYLAAKLPLPTVGVLKRNDTVVAYTSEGDVYDVGTLSEFVGRGATITGRTRGVFSVADTKQIKAAEKARDSRLLSNIPSLLKHIANAGDVVCFSSTNGFMGAEDRHPTYIGPGTCYLCRLTNVDFAGVMEVESLNTTQRRWVADDHLDWVGEGTLATKLSADSLAQMLGKVDRG